MAFTKILVLLHLLVRLTVIFVIPVCWGYTYEQDVYAINNLYASLGSPLLPGWIPNGGDPCVELWQGVECVGPNITAIILNGANLGGELGDKLENFSSIITIDLSNNHIGGSIPENLPITMQRFFLSDNAFTGSIPDSLSQLTSLTAMSLNNNMLIGALPDAFQSLTGLINLDLSFNNLSSQLPPSMESLSSLTTLHIQKNQLSGTLDVLQDLPLKDLNVENNLFSGPVPTKLYSIPNFRSDGNPFNTTISPASPSPSPPSGTPDSSAAPSNPANGPSAQDDRPPTRRTKWSTQRIVGCAFAAAIAVIILVLAVMLVANYCLSKQRERKSNHEITPKSREFGTYARPRVEPRHTDYPTLPSNHLPTHEIKNVPKEAASKQQEELDIDKMSIVLAPPPVEKIVVDPIAPVEKTRTPSPERLQSPPSAVNLNPATSVLSFSVGTLQQYTDSFSEENVIRDTRLGRVYQGRLSDGKVVQRHRDNISGTDRISTLSSASIIVSSIKKSSYVLSIVKIDNPNDALPVDEFLELVLRISELRHPNIVELVGYCAEYGQRLLVYSYLSKRTLHDVLHNRDDAKGKLSWNARIQVALGAAQALEYLHESCQPPVVHQNFESSNILLDDELAVRVCDCGLAPLLSSNSVTQLSGRIRSFSYEAPEVSDSGLYTEHSDVYSFGVVMLELLTGRKPYDSSRSRAEQYLVRWASSQFYDINMLSKMVDPSINGKYPVKSLSRFADIISRCIQDAPEFRPLMSEVVQDLTRMVDEMKESPSGSSAPA